MWIYRDVQLLRNRAGGASLVTRCWVLKVCGKPWLRAPSLVDSAAGMPEGDGGPQLPELASWIGMFAWVSPAPCGAPQEM